MSPCSEILANLEHPASPIALINKTRLFQMAKRMGGKQQMLRKLTCVCTGELNVLDLKLWGPISQKISKVEF